MSNEPHSFTSCDVAIVGCGPTGATLANLLANCGVSVLVLEREPAAYHLPRAVHFDDETMRIFQAAGIADDLKDKIRINPGMRFVDRDGDLLLDWPRPQKVSEQGWHASYRLHQPDLEGLLRDRLQECATVTVRTGTEVTSLADAEEGVLIGTKDRETGEIGKARAKFVVGCDGGRSFVRAQIDPQMEDLGFRERWLVVDVLLKRAMPELGDHTIQYCDPARPMTYCRSPATRRRWEVTVHDHEDAADIARPERVWEFLAKWVTPEDADLERSAVYTFHSAVARTWRSGNLLLAGDAAHLTPPFMGQGMCAGIRDAANLAWKLAQCLKGSSGADVLDTYESERRPHVTTYIETAMRLGGLINSLDRDSALALAADTQSSNGRATIASIAPALGPGVSANLPDTLSEHSGKLFAQPVLAGGVSMDDAIGYRFALISLKPLLAIGAALSEDEPKLLNGQDEPSLCAPLNALGVEAVLIRPDRYILASAASDDEVPALRDLYRSL